MTFGANVDLIRYEEADETGTIEGFFAGWGGTLVSIYSKISNSKIILYQ